MGTLFTQLKPDENEISRRSTKVRTQSRGRRFAYEGAFRFPFHRPAQFNEELSVAPFERRHRYTVLEKNAVAGVGSYAAARCNDARNIERVCSADGDQTFLFLVSTD